MVPTKMLKEPRCSARSTEMPRDLPLDQALRMTVLSWKSTEDGLLMRVGGEDIRLVCRCGRSHWIVHESLVGNRASLILVCHNCGTRATFEIEGVRAAAP